MDANSEPVDDYMRKRAKLRDLEDMKVVGDILSTPEGRGWLYRLLERCHIYSSPFDPMSSESTAFRLGEENIGKLLMIAAMDANPQSYMRMIREGRDKESVEDQDLTEIEETAEAAKHQVPDLPPPAGWESPS